MLWEYGQDADDALVAEASHRLRFAHEALEAPLIQFVMLVASWQDRSVVLAFREVRRKVLFDGDLLVEVGVVRQIGDAETARS